MTATGMRIGSLFAGYGGAELAVQSVFPDATPAWFVEYDKHPSAVLAAHWPDVPNYGDVTTVDWAQLEPVDILTAGWPCQPFSHAGQRRGTDDDRHLWPYVADAVRVLRPRYLFGENVAGHLSLGFDTVLADLAGLGFDARWGVVRASDAGAPHRRARLFIVATATDEPGDGWGEGRPESGQRSRGSGQPAWTGPDTATDPDEQGPQGTHPARRPDLPAGGTASRARCRCRVTADTEGDEQRQPAEPGPLRPEPRHGADAGTVRVDVGPYAAAVARWEHVTGRHAPVPTEPGRDNRPRLSPRFVEWLMGLPDGWVTDTGIPRAAQLKALGNGIVPQQMALALRLLLDDEVAA